MIGKSLRLAKLSYPGTSKFFLFPIDHAVTYGPISGIKDYCSIISLAVEAGVSGIILHKGLFSKLYHHEKLCAASYILHLSAATCYNKSNTKILVSSVEQAVKLGAVGVSVQVNIGVDEENLMLKDLGLVSEQCYKWGMPLIAMMYFCSNEKKAFDTAHAARIAEELGADIVKINYPGSITDFESVVESVNIPVIIAGGEKQDHLAGLFSSIRDAILAKGSGVAIGRNIFQSEDPGFIISLIKKIIITPSCYESCVAELVKFDNGSMTICK